MNTVRFTGFADQFLILPVSAETKRRMGIPPGDATVIVDPTVNRQTLEDQLGYQLTPIS